MPTKIQIRRGTATQWTTADPTLSSGEFGLETDTGKVKLGDGSTAWTSLAYFGNLEALDNVGDVVITSASNGQVLQFNGTNWVNATLDLSGKQDVVADVSSTEIGYLNGVTSAIQTQLDGKAASSHTHGMSDLTAFEVTSPATGQTLQYNGTKWVNAAAAGGETISSFLLMGA